MLRDLSNVILDAQEALFLRVFEDLESSTEIESRP